MSKQREIVSWSDAHFNPGDSPGRLPNGASIAHRVTIYYEGSTEPTHLYNNAAIEFVARNRRPWNTGIINKG